MLIKKKVILYVLFFAGVSMVLHHQLYQGPTAIPVSDPIIDVVEPYVELDPVEAKKIVEPDLKLRKGIQKKRFKDGQIFFLYLPANIAENPQTPVQVVAVIHGYTGQTPGGKGHKIVLKNMERFKDYAEEHQTIIIAPHFDGRIFENDYQRLNLDGPRADERLLAIVESLEGTFPNIQKEKISLFGFSGGGQFVHRFCAFYPERVHKAVVSGSGWYMWPDPTINYPLGTNLDNYEKHGVFRTINLERFVETPIQVLIGAIDLQQGSFREEYKEVDLNAWQGNSRIVRAENWVKAMKAYAEQKGLTDHIQLVVVPDTEHRTTNELMDEAYNFLSEPL